MFWPATDTAKKQDGGMCVSVHVCRVSWRKSGRIRDILRCLPFPRGDLAPQPSSFSTPPSMCCCWIRLIKASQIGSPERACVHTCICICTRSLTGVGIDTQKMQGENGQETQERAQKTRKDIINYNGGDCVTVFMGCFMNHFLLL